MDVSKLHSLLGTSDPSPVTEGKDEDDGDQWITINGVHVEIDAEGNITKGPPDLVGKSKDSNKGLRQRRDVQKMSPEEFTKNPNDSYFGLKNSGNHVHDVSRAATSDTHWTTGKDDTPDNHKEAFKSHTKAAKYMQAKVDEHNKWISKYEKWLQPSSGVRDKDREFAKERLAQYGKDVKDYELARDRHIAVAQVHRGKSRGSK
jgi:hypothetical protein